MGYENKTEKRSSCKLKNLQVLRSLSFREAAFLRREISRNSLIF